MANDFKGIAGLAYLTNSFALLISPAFEAMIFPGILIPALIAELTLGLWLIVRGVNVQKWRARMEQVAVAPAAAA